MTQSQGSPLVPPRLPAPALLPSILAFAAAFAVYLRTLHPGLAGPDSGELITVARTLGVAHPPGYPLYTLLGHGFATVVSWGSYAWRLNLMSALMQAGAVGLLCAAVCRLTGSAVAGLAASLALAFARAWWKSALVAEVFPLNDLMAALLWFAFAALLRDAGLVSAGVRSPADAPRKPWPPAVLLLVTAAIPGHHHSLVLLAIPTDAVALGLLALPAPALTRLLPGFRRPYAFRASHLWVGVALVLAGLSPLAYLPLAAARDPAIAWGDPDSWSRFLAHLLRAEYGSLSLGAPRPDLAGDTDHAVLYLRSIPAQFGWPGATLAAAGAALLAHAAVRGGRREVWHPAAQPLALAVFSAALLQWFFFSRISLSGDLPYCRGVVERFYPLPHLSVALLAGLGGAAVVGVVPARGRIAAGVALAAFSAFFPIRAHFRTVDQRGNTFMADLCHDVLASLPPRTVLFPVGDEFFGGLSYQMLVEGERPDVTVVDQLLLTRPWYVRQLRRRDRTLLPPFTHAAEPDSDFYRGDSLSGSGRWLDHLAGRRPVAFISVFDTTYRVGYELVRHGHVEIAYARGAEPSAGERARAAARLLDSLRTESYFRPQDPLSAEAANRSRVPESLASFCFLLCDPEGRKVRRSEYPGLVRLARFIDRFEREVPAPDPVLLRAAGFLRAFHPDFLDPDRAAEDIERYLASGATGSEAEGARLLLAMIHATTSSH